MERRPNTQPNSPGVIHEPLYVNVDFAFLNILRKNAIRFLTGKKITKEELNSIAIRENDPDSKHFELAGGVGLERTLTSFGLTIETYRINNLSYRITYDPDTRVAGVTKITSDHHTQKPAPTPNPINDSFLEG